MCNSDKKWIRVFFYSLASISFAIICYRAAIINITNDEAFSFFLIKTHNLNALATTANTHWLNSFGMKLIYLLGFDQVFMLRMLSVLSFGVYAYFVYRFLPLFKSTPTKILFIVLFFCNPMALEYFSLARGYAISLAFFMGTSFFALRFLEAPADPKNLRKTFLFAMLSLLGNFTALFPIIALFLYLLVIYRKAFFAFFLQKKNFWMMVLFVITVLGALLNMLLIKYISNDLQYGADHYFLFESLNSMVLYLAFRPSPSSVGELNYLVSGFSVLIVLGTIFTLFLALKQKNRFLAFGPFLFLLTWFFYLLSHLLFATPYPLARTTLILFPTLAFTLVFGVDFIAQKKLSFTLSSLIGGALIFFTISSFSLHHTLEYRNQADAELVFEDLINGHSKENKPLSLLSDEPYYAVWKNYYSQIDSTKYAFNYSVLSKTERLDSLEVISLLNGKNYFITRNTTNNCFTKTCLS